MTTLATDNFNRADSGNLGSNWTLASSITDCNVIPIASNKASAPLGIGYGEFYNAASFPNDQWGQVTIVTADTTSDCGFGIILRYSASGMYFAQASTHESRIYKGTAPNTYAQVGSDGPGFADGDVFYSEIQGTTLVVKNNGSTVITATDSSFSSGAVGLWASGSGTTSTADDWSAGDFAGASDTLFAQVLT